MIKTEDMFAGIFIFMILALSFVFVGMPILFYLEHHSNWWIGVILPWAILGTAASCIGIARVFRQLRK